MSEDELDKKSMEQLGLKRLGCFVLGPAYPFADQAQRDAYLLKPQHLWLRIRGSDDRTDGDTLRTRDVGEGSS